MKTIKKPKIRRIAEQLALRPMTVSSRDPVAHAAAIKVLG